MRILVFMLVLIPTLAFSQSRLSITAFGGAANYHGDLQPKRLSFAQSSFVGGLGLQYELHPRLELRGEIRYGHLSGADSTNTEQSLRGRNLNFTTRLYEASLLAQYNFGDILEKRIVPYLFAGLALYHFSPYTFDSTGKKVMLQPLRTEGQGLPQYPGKKMYNLNQVAIPFGFGVNYAVNDKVTLGFEFGLRKLFTDYIDDVGGTYADPNILLAEVGKRSVDFSYRGDELKNGNPVYPAEGSVRGGKFKDWYYHTGLIVRYRIFNLGYARRSSGNPRYLKQVDCPKF